MKRLILMRHSQSQGNKLGIIQGPTKDYGLTEDGIREAYDTFQNNKETLESIEQIISSPLKRAIQTGQVINYCYGKGNYRKIKKDKTLTEFDAGVLSGMRKDDAEKSFPEYYKIWTDRKDLDGIPGAEKGEELQARAVSFLMEYYDREEFSELIITHAGFLRCLLNTINGNDRTTPVDVKNAVLHITEDPLKNLKILRKERAMSSKVYIVETKDGKYVIKQKERNLNEMDREEERILKNLSSEITDLPLILNMRNKKDGSSVKVLKYVPGKHIYGKINERYEESFTDKVKLIHEQLQTQNSSAYIKCDLLEFINEIKENSKNNYLVMIAKSLMEDKKNTKKLDNSEYCLVHFDLNRDNILFDEENEKIKTNIIDWESIGLYPKEYQLASFLASGYLLDNGNMNRAMQLAKRFDANFDEEFLIYLMKIRLLTGMHFFIEKANNYVKNNSKIADEILQKYIDAYSKIEIYKKDIKKSNVKGERGWE